MLGYAGVDGYVTYGRGNTATDLDAIQKITKSVTGTAMNWDHQQSHLLCSLSNDNKVF